MTLRTRDIRALQVRAAKSRCFAHPGLVLQVLEGEIVCRKCNGSLKLESIPSETEKFMTGQTQSAAIHSKMTQKYGEWNMPTESQVTDVATIDPTQTDIERVGKKFADTVENFGATGEAELSRSDLVLAAKLEMAGFQHFHFFVQQRRYQEQGQWHVKSSLYMNVKGRYFNAQQSMGPAYGGVTLEIISDEAVRKAAGVPPEEVLVQATLWEKVPGGQPIPRQQSFGRAGGPRDEKQPVARANKLEMAETRAEARVLERGAALGVPIGTYAEVAGVVVVSDGEGQVKALEAGEERVALEAPANVDTRTGEIKNNNNAAKRQELIDRLKANGIDQDKLSKFEYPVRDDDIIYTGMKAVIEMLRAGGESHLIADAVSEQLALSASEDEGQVTVDAATNEDVEELPW